MTATALRPLAAPPPGVPQAMNCSDSIMRGTPSSAASAS